MVVLRRAPSKKLNLQAGAKIQLVPDQWVAFGSRCTPMCVGPSVEKTAHYVCQPLCRWRRCCLRFWPLSLFHQRRRELQSCRAMAPFWTFYICAICHCFVLMKMARANQHLSSQRTDEVPPNQGKAEGMIKKGASTTNWNNQWEQHMGALLKQFEQPGCLLEGLYCRSGLL